MLNTANLRDYQKAIIRHVLAHPQSMVWAGMGLGKTIATLTALEWLLDTGQILGALVVAPKRIIQTVWRQEAKGWEHTRGLTFSLVNGTEAERSVALRRPADIYLTNPENLTWLLVKVKQYWSSKGRYPPFQMLVLDEITKFKNPRAKRSEALQALSPYFPRRIGLTGEPASNGYTDLFGQYLAIDDGKRLGLTVEGYRNAFLKPKGYMGYSWEATRTGRERIRNKIADITIEMSEREYFKDLPEVTYNQVMVDLPPRARKVYDTLERELFAQLDSGASLEVMHEASKINKLIQVASGAAYLTAGGPWEEVHHEKIDALEDIMEEATGRPLLLGYGYVHEAKRIAQKFPERPQTCTGASFLSSSLSERALDRILVAWRRNKIPLLCGHPACLHPLTEVLTELRGWVKLAEVEHTDRVFDGTEFVSHDGCQYSGLRHTVEVFGIKMTPDHKLLVSGEWVKAKDVGNIEDARRKALYQYEEPSSGGSTLFPLRGHTDIHQAERAKTQPGKANTLPLVCRGEIPPSDRHAHTPNLVRSACSLQGHQPRTGSTKLQRPGYCCLRAMELFRKLLRRYARKLLGRSNNRTDRHERSLLQRELSLGHPLGAAGQQAQQPGDFLPGGNDAPGGILPPYQGQSGEDNRLLEPGVNRGPGGGSRSAVDIQQGPTEESPVFDLVNCGPRSRFLIRNTVGDCFISHNSIGHGLNLQGSECDSLVWFSLPWSLELYKQMNARLIGGHRRQRATVIHHLVARDTFDEVVYATLESKHQTQEKLKAAVNDYRKRRGL